MAILRTCAISCLVGLAGLTVGCGGGVVNAPPAARVERDVQLDPRPGRTSENQRPTAAAPSDGSMQAARSVDEIRFGGASTATGTAPVLGDPQRLAEQTQAFASMMEKWLADREAQIKARTEQLSQREAELSARETLIAAAEGRAIGTRPSTPTATATSPSMDTPATSEQTDAPSSAVAGPRSTPDVSGQSNVGQQLARDEGVSQTEMSQTDGVQVQPSQAGTGEPIVGTVMAEQATVRLERAGDETRAAAPRSSNAGTTSGLPVSAPVVTPSVEPFLMLEDRYTRRLASDPRDVRSQLDLQLLRLIQGQPVPVVSELNALPPEDRELLAAVLEGLSSYRGLVEKSGNPMAAEKARPFVEMVERISARGDLSISAAALCSGVMAFGVYEPLERVFVAGQLRPMVFYCEVDGFASQLDADGRWETKLSLELRLFTESGLEVWQDSAKPVEDKSRRRRRDFFINKRVILPPALAPGRYLLKAAVEDQLAGRVSETTLGIEIVGK